MVFGYDRYNDQRQAENHQSGSDYRILGTSTVVRGDTVYPHVPEQQLDDHPV